MIRAMILSNDDICASIIAIESAIVNYSAKVGFEVYSRPRK